MRNGLIIDENSKRWYKNDQLHREDGPAVEYTSGNKYWYKEGEIHKDDGPAAEYNNGDKVWYKKGKKHREDGPAIEFVDGSKWWYYNNELIKCSSQKEFEKIIKYKLFL